MYNEPNIAKKASVLKTEISLEFTDTKGDAHQATIVRDEADPEKWDVSVDGVTITKQEERKLKEFLFCERNENGDVTIDGKKYFCHEVKAASEGAFLLGNHFCPYFLNPPGIWLNL